MLRFLFASGYLQGLVVGNVSIVVVAVGFDGALGEGRGLFETSAFAIRAAEKVPGSLTIVLALDGALSQQPGLVVFVLRVKNTGVREMCIRDSCWVRCTGCRIFLLAPSPRSPI